MGGDKKSTIFMILRMSPEGNSQLFLFMPLFWKNGWIFEIPFRSPWVFFRPSLKPSMHLMKPRGPWRQKNPPKLLRLSTKNRNRTSNLPGRCFLSIGTFLELPERTFWGERTFLRTHPNSLRFAEVCPLRLPLCLVVKNISVHQLHPWTLTSPIKSYQPLPKGWLVFQTRYFKGANC